MNGMNAVPRMEQLLLPDSVLQVKQKNPNILLSQLVSLYKPVNDDQVKDGSFLFSRLEEYVKQNSKDSLLKRADAAWEKMEDGFFGSEQDHREPFRPGVLAEKLDIPREPRDATWAERASDWYTLSTIMTTLHQWIQEELNNTKLQISDADKVLTEIKNFWNDVIVLNQTLAPAFAEQGKCARCGRTLKGAGPLGPECAKIA